MIYLIVGNTGSGKTTYAHHLKRTNGGVLFSIDSWNKTLFLSDKKPSDGLNWFLERIDRIEAIIVSLISQLEHEKTDVILDLGLSKFKHREKFRKFAHENGYQISIHFLDISRSIRLDRVRQRNIKKGPTFEFEVTDDNFEFMETWFERPSKIEMQNGIIITG